MDELSLRSSDAEREEAVERAPRASARGPTHARGVHGARRAPPTVRAPAASSPGSARTSRTRCRQPPARRRRPSRFTPAVFAHVIRRGRLRLPRRSVAFSVFADVDLDLRDAAIDNPVSTVRVFAFFGNADVYVPEGVDADVGGLTIVGHRRDWGRTPRLRMRRRSACVWSDCSRRSTSGGCRPRLRRLSGDHRARQSRDRKLPPAPD